MTRVSTLTITTILLLALPVTHAQLTIRQMEDASGDVAFQPPTGPANAPPGTFDHIDLRAMEISETDSTFRFVIFLQSLHPQSQFDGPQIVMGFRHHSTEFRVTAGIMAQAVSANGGGILERRAVGGTEWDFAAQLAEIPFDASLPGLVIEVPRALLADEDGTPPIPGRLLEDFWTNATDYVTRMALVGPAPTISDVVPIKDMMPDAGVTSEPYAIQLGLGQSGTVKLGSPRPSRASNGEETTYLFEINALNMDSVGHTYIFDVENAPKTWEITLPVPAATLQANEKITFSVIVATPFAHQHTGYQNLTVVARNLNETNDQSKLTLSVLYLTVPQPSGHHPNLYLHSKGPAMIASGPIGEGYGVGIYMNSLGEDDQDAKLAARAEPIPSENPSITLFRWCARLEPSLSLGLDFDAQMLGKASFSFESTTPITGTLAGALVLVEPTGDGRAPSDSCFGPRPWVAVALLAPFEADLGTNPTLELDISAAPGTNIVPYVDGRDLFLDLRFEAKRPTGPTVVDAPVLLPGGVLTLPLQEFHDPLMPNQHPSGTQLVIDGEGYLQRNPGKVALITGHLTGDARHEYTLDVVGTHPDWGHFIGEPVVSSSKPKIHFVLTIPAAASDGEIANLLIVGRTTANPLEVMYARIVVEVDNDLEHPDDREAALQLEQTTRNTPILPPYYLLVVILILTAKRRCWS